MKQLLETLLGHLPAILVTVVSSQGSVPRGPGAVMAVGAEGRLCGTVGGGAVEGRAIAAAREVLAAGTPLRKTEKLREGGDAGMVCGGSVELLFLPLGEAHRPVLAAALQAVTDNRPGWLVLEDAGGIAVQETPACPSREGVFALPLCPAGTVYIFGGGHVAQALVPVLAAAEFRCVVLEDRPEFADKARFPAAAEVRLYPAGAPDAPLTGQDYVCIMTHGHHADLECEAFALRSPARYIGVMGSRRKTESVNARLRAMGFGEEDFRRVHTPIGLAIGAQTPGEIAVSIAAEMIAVRAGTL